MHTRGVAATSVEDVLEASGAGKGQLYHHFAGKDDLVAEVIALQASRVLDEQAAELDSLSSIAAIEAWLEGIAQRHEERGFKGGCPVGSLASELSEGDERLRLLLAEVFDRWEGRLARGLEELRSAGRLRHEADPEALAAATMASLQGGYLLATTRRDSRPMRHALDAALERLRAFER